MGGASERKEWIDLATSLDHAWHSEIRGIRNEMGGSVLACESNRLI
jgi:hypothetical protein